MLFSDFYENLPDKAQLEDLANDRLAYARDAEEAIESLTYFRNERQFQAGVQFLKRMIDAPMLGKFLSDLAEICVQKLTRTLSAEFEKTYGRVPEAEFAIIALGKCGSCELTFHSDLDLVFVYDVPDFERLSDGEKSYSPSVYYNRLAQRVVNALSGMNRAGRLYEVDTRLRPSGAQGLLAVSTQALNHYFDELAWTFEYMAFTKARVIAGEPGITATLTDFIQRQISKPRDMQKLKSDVQEMRDKMAQSYETLNIWDLKHHRGGLVDVDFIAQYLLLRHAPEHTGAPLGSSETILAWCENQKLVDSGLLHNIREANRFMTHLFHLLRLCIDGVLREEDAEPGLRKLLCDASGLDSFDELKSGIRRLEESVHAAYIAVIGN